MSTPVPAPLSIKTNMLWNSAGSLVYLGSQWFMTVLVVKLSSTYDAAGVLGLAMAVSNIFAPVADYRMKIIQISDVKKENSVGEYFAFRLITSAIAMAGMVVYAFLTCPPEALVPILLYCLTRLLSFMIDVLHAFDQVNGRMDYIGKSLMLQGCLTLVAFTTVFGLTESLSWAFVSMAIVTTAIGVMFDLPRALRFGAIHVGIQRKKALHLLVYCLPIVISAIAAAAAPAIPRQVLAALEGVDVLGIYVSVAAPAAIIQMGAGYIYNPLMPLFARDYALGRTKELTRLLLKVVGGITVIGVVFGILLEIFGPWLLRTMFDESIDPYFYLMQPIIILTVVSGYVWFISSLLIALRSFRGEVAGNIVALVISIPAAYFFIAHWSMNGVSFAAISAYLIGGLVMLFSLVRVLRTAPKDTPIDAETTDQDTDLGGAH